jgi:histidinol-phosphate/aromatic aminotransferase/cobyric acid decarboxylase-like protein
VKASKGKPLPFRAVLGRVWPYGMALALASAGFGVIATFITLFYDAKGWDGAAFALTLFSCAFVGARLLFPNGINRLGGLNVAMICFAVEIVGLLLTGIASAPWMAKIGVFLAGAGFSLVFPALGVEVVKRVALQPPHFRPDWQAFAALLSDKMRLVILNTPHNPSATVWQKADFAALWQAIAEREIYVLSDEVYEHICFAAEGHASVLAHPQLRERAVAVSSFGKTYHMTGWKVGYCVAPAAISAELRKVHQYLTFAVNTPAQLALADMLRSEPQHYRELPDFYRARRDMFVNALSKSRLEILPCEGTYFLLADYSAISDLDDVSFCRWLTKEVGVAAIPLSVFCADPFPHKLIRLCFAKQESTLLAAAERLATL